MSDEVVASLKNLKIDKIGYNGASIPKLLQPLKSYYDAVAGDTFLVHDYLYSDAGRMAQPHIDRATADRLMLDGLLANPSVSRIDAYTIYVAVRMFGGLYY